MFKKIFVLKIVEDPAKLTESVTTMITVEMAYVGFSDDKIAERVAEKHFVKKSTKKPTKQNHSNHTNNQKKNQIKINS